ncbi:MAG: 4Fe-4S cluster-binding domain-containing protein, partial [Syntrophaceae bacterium]|nr:4Fe-4S cluster-binding domain-containing protein [Syntrophaceae bacterium]
MERTEVITILGTEAEARKWKFAELLDESGVRERWEKVRKYFFLRESTYDMTNRCNIRCDGCYYYEGDKQFAAENRDPKAWRKLMQDEKMRGITYVVLAGAEPSLVPELLEVCYQEM